MAAKLEDLEAEALRLDPDDRAALAQALIESLGEPSPSEILGLWVAEAERRDDEWERGEVEGRSLERVLRRAAAALE